MGKVIVSPVVLIVAVLVIVAGYFIMSRIIMRKWGYTPEREKELEEMKEKDKFTTKRDAKNKVK